MTGIEEQYIDDAQHIGLSNLPTVGIGRKVRGTERREAKMISFSGCCKIGTYEHTVPMPINGRVQGIDYCIADIVAALNAGGIETEASCCGHGKGDGIISFKDGRELKVFLPVFNR
jgi:hypothetical protein